MIPSFAVDPTALAFSCTFPDWVSHWAAIPSRATTTKLSRRKNRPAWIRPV